LKYKNRGVSRGFLYFKQHFDTEEVIILQTRKQKYYFDSTIGKYKVDSSSKRIENDSLGAAHTPRYLIVCKRSVIYFL
jgi:hypothetical protein